MTPMVIVTDTAPYTVRAMGTYGGGYTEPGNRDTLVARAANALGYELYGRRRVDLVAPAWVKTALREMGYKV